MSIRMDVPMTEISRRVYDNASKTTYVIAKRACGFVTEITGEHGQPVRRMYVEFENVCYTGQMLPWESIEDFKTFEFHGVETEVKAKFRRVLENA